MRTNRWILVAVLLAASAVLLWHARIYDFVCDDAFIALRYAQNVARFGSPVYNPGERVEGYTDFLWVMLNVPGALLHANPVTWVRGLGALSGIGLLIAAWAYVARLAPDRLGARVFAVFALALFAPVAAWTLGGLETPLFAAFATTGLALAADLAPETTGSKVRPIVAGIVFALATLTRPEGALWFAVAFVVLSRFRARTSAGRKTLGWLLLGYGLVVVPFVIWRWRYYGYPLPNTYYVKFSGHRRDLWLRGGGYLLLALRELNPVFVLLVVASLVLPAKEDDTHRTDAAANTTRRATFAFARTLIPVFTIYVASVGGDFLDLYRFFVPVLPVAIGVVAIQGGSQLDRIGAARASPNRKRAVGIVLAVAALAGHAVQQGKVGTRALQVVEPTRIERGIEPLGWTRLYALRWAAMGRWLRRHSRPGDAMASGAAGAIAFYSGLINIDTLGLCDPFVAHQGDVIGDRPGHQRFAPHWYLIDRHPVFILLGDDIISDESRWIDHDPGWEADGWTWVEVRVGPEDGAPGVFYHRMLVANERLASWGELRDVRRAGE